MASKQIAPRLTVTQTVCQMIYNWPSITEGRLPALSRVFTCSGDWIETPEGAYPELEDSLGTTSPIDQEAKYLAECEKMGRKVEGRDLLFRRRQDAKHRFTRENAEIMAEEDFFNRFKYPPSFSTYKLNRLPLETMEPQWKAALIEFCKAVLDYSEKDALEYHREHAEQSRKRAVSDLAEAHRTAKECLARLGVGDKPEIDARKAAIAELQRQAENLGMKLVKA
jgi:hypothetical protein